MTHNGRKLIFLAILLIIFLTTFLIAHPFKQTGQRLENISTTTESDSYEKKITQLSEQYPEAKEILAHVYEYPAKLLELALRNPETIDFVINYQKNSHPNENEKIVVDYKKGTIPHFLQWDKRWGYYNYGENLIALNGCGPTALSMVAVGLTGNTFFTPKAVANFSAEHGYLAPKGGSSWTLMSQGATELGLTVKELSFTKQAIISALQKGQPIIVSVGKGDFTTTGHFIVLKSLTKEETILVNDPNSIKNSKKEWTVETIMQQTRNLWAFSKKS